jgi:ankyrin repeat protein
MASSNHPTDPIPDTGKDDEKTKDLAPENSSPSENSEQQERRSGSPLIRMTQQVAKPFRVIGNRIRDGNRPIPEHKVSQESGGGERPRETAPEEEENENKPLPSYEERQQELSLMPLFESPRYDSYRTESHGVAALHNAAADGKTDLARYLLYTDIATRNNINATDEKGWTALDLAANMGHIAVVREILDWNPNINATDEHRVTALHRAVENGHAAVVRVLLEKKANVDAKDGSGKTAIRRAVEKDYPTVVRQLLSGPDPKTINDEDNDGLTPIQYAIDKAQVEVLRIILKRVLISIKRRSGQNGLFHRAVKNGHAETVRVILEEVKPDIDAKDDRKGWTALQWAADKGNDEVVRVLLEQPKIDVNAKDKNGWSALHRAADKNRPEVVALLLSKNAKHDIENNAEETALYWAAGSDSYEAVIQLLKYCEKKEKTEKGVLKKFVNKPNFEKATALHEAARQGRTELVQLLLSVKVGLTSEDQNNQTALSLAAGHGHNDVVKLLLGKYEKDAVPAKVKAQNFQKALEEAIKGKYPEVIETLLKKVSEVSKTPDFKLDMAVLKRLASLSGNPKVWQLIEGHSSNGD